MTVGRRQRWVPRAWVLLLALAGAGVVALSWTAPESAHPRPGPDAVSGYQQVSFSGCAQDVAPDYGVRSVSDIQCVR